MSQLAIVSNGSGRVCKERGEEGGREVEKEAKREKEA